MATTFKYYLSAALLVFSIIGRGQVGNAIIDSAYYYYDYDKVDAAEALFQKAANEENNDASLKLKVTGLLKIAVFLVDLSKADSLQLVGKNLIDEK
ncbi:MAG: hypothetical protein R2728_16055 [Chitinophagales bacterium]